MSSTPLLTSQLPLPASHLCELASISLYLCQLEYPFCLSMLYLYRSPRCGRPLMILYCTFHYSHPPSAFHHPLSTLYFPLSIFHSLLSTLYFPLSTLHLRLSTFDFPPSSLYLLLPTTQFHVGFTHAYTEEGCRGCSCHTQGRLWRRGSCYSRHRSQEDSQKASCPSQAFQPAVYCCQWCRSY